MKTVILMVASYFVNFILLSVYSPFAMLVFGPFMDPATLQQLNDNPGYSYWLMSFLILVPGLLMQLSPFQRLMIFFSGYKPAKGEYRAMLEQALQPIIARGGLEGEKFHLYVNPDKSINACALGDNNIVVNEPMFRYFTVDELSGVLAHEMGHLQKGHTWKLLLLWGMTLANRVVFWCYRMVLMIITVLQFIPFIGWVLGFFALIMNFFLQIGNWVLTYPLILFNRYCARQDEYAADDYACHIGLGPELYEGLAKIDDMYHNPRLSFFGRMLSDHPATDERLQRIREYVEEHRTM